MSVKTDMEMRKDHETVRNQVGYYDFTHELLEVTGEQREQFLDRIFVNSVGATDPGGAQYTTMLDEDAVILDDVIVFRVSDETYWVSTLDIDSMIEWFDKNSSNYKVEYKNITDSNVMYAVQGPKSRKVLNQFLEKDISDLSWFSITDNKVDGVPVKVARAGFTGELGFEIYVNPDNKDLIVDKLKDAGEPYGIREITTNASLKSLPVEKGYVLMSDVGGTNPLEAGFGWSIDWDTNFIGKKALQKAKEDGVNRKLRNFELKEDSDDIEIEEGATVQFNGENVGTMTSFTYGYTVEKYIGYALVDSNKTSVGDTVTINGYEAELTKGAFYDPKRERLTA